MKYIGLLDCNNFFVSCERLFRPGLNNKPVAVLSGNDGCIVARSKEVKDMGIPMGVPYFQVKDILLQSKTTLFSSHFALYRDISRRVFEVVRTMIEDIEQYSVDECFFVFESEEPEEFMWKLKRQVELEVGIPVSVGAAASKTQAKYVNSVAKKTNGVAVWDAEKWGGEIKNIKLSEIWGVGAGRSRQFSQKEIVTVFDFLNLDQQVVSRLFGIEGQRLRDELMGKSRITVMNMRVAQKSIMSTRSFAKTTTDINVLDDAVRFHLHQNVADLNDMDLLATSMKVMIAPSRHGDYMLQGSSKEVLLTSPTKDLFVLQKVASELLKACYKPDVPYKKAGVLMSNLVANESITASLFDSPANQSTTKNLLTDTVLSINNRFGKNLVQLGRSEAGRGTWQSKSESLSPSYTTKWSDLLIVKA
jgi:DNA polymerase V